MNNIKFILHLLQALAPVILLGLVGVNYSDFVIHAIEGNTFLNSCIIIVGMIGAVLFVLRIIDAGRERISLLRYATEVGQGGNMTELLEADWLRGRLMHRFLEFIAETGGKLSSQLDQTAIESELHSLEDEFNSKMELPSFLVGFMIAMGLLGTFIGLLETLTGISGMLDGLANGPSTASIDTEFLKLVGELRKPLAGMGIAFSASMFGLVGSLVLGLMQLTARRFNKVVMADARDTLHRLVERVRGALPVGGVAQAAPTSARGGVSEEFLSEFLSEMVSNMNSLQELFHRSQDASLSVATRVDTLARKLEEVSAAIESNVEANKRTNDLLGFGPRMKETNEEMLGEIRALLTNGQDHQKSMTRMVDTLSAIDQKLSVSNDSTRTHYEMVGTINGQTLSKLDEAVGVLHDVNDRTSDSEAKLDRKLQALTAAVGNIGGGLQQLASKLSEVATIGQNQLTASSSGQTMLRDSASEVQGLLKELQEKVQKVQEVEIGATRHLYGIKESFDNMGTMLESLKGLSAGVTRQTSLLEATLEEMRTSQRNMARDMRAELREVARGAVRDTP